MSIFKLPFSKEEIGKACAKNPLIDREAIRRRDEVTINEIVKRNKHLKIDISEVNDIVLQISPEYREDIIISKFENRVEIEKEYCIPEGPMNDEIGSELESLKVFNV